MPSTPAPAARPCPLHRSRGTRRLEDGPTGVLCTSDAPQQPTFLIDVRHDQPRPLLRLAGELDVATAPLVTAVLDHLRQRQSEPAGHPHVLDLSSATDTATGTGTQRHGADERLDVDVDLSLVSFADTHGLAPVLDSRARVVAASPVVWRLLGLLAAAGARQPGSTPPAPTGRRLHPVAQQGEGSGRAGRAEPGA